jgi:hypothetical protein
VASLNRPGGNMTGSSVLNMAIAHLGSGVCIGAAEDVPSHFELLDVVMVGERLIALEKHRTFSEDVRGQKN